MPQNRILRERVAGQSAMSAVVEAQALALPLGRLGRLFGMSPLTAAGRAHYRGALGELLVGDVLDDLGPAWDVLHDLPLESSTLDHLLIGRAGVFSIRTADFGRADVVVDGDSLLVDGEASDDIASARVEADEVARLLGEAAGVPVRVRPLLVVIDPKRLAIRASAAGLRVIGSFDLERVLTRAPHTLTGDDVARLSDVADLVTTWPPGRGTELDTRQVHREFELIRSDVREAIVRRVFWAGATTVLVCASTMGTVATLVSLMVLPR